MVSDQIPLFRVLKLGLSKHAEFISTRLKEIKTLEHGTARRALGVLIRLSSKIETASDTFRELMLGFTPELIRDPLSLGLHHELAGR